MNEIERRAQHAWEWLLFLNLSRIKNQTEWCATIGLYETAGWVDEDGNGMLEWVKPGIFKT